MILHCFINFLDKAKAQLTDRQTGRHPFKSKHQRHRQSGHSTDYMYTAKQSAESTNRNIRVNSLYNSRIQVLVKLDRLIKVLHLKRHKTGHF